MLIHYFVDGGYFDQPGAGVVQEMMRHSELYRQKQWQHIKRRVGVFIRIIHITNSPQVFAKLDAVSPLKNDLMAPVQTIVGAWYTDHGKWPAPG